MKTERRTDRDSTATEIATWIRRYRASGLTLPAFAKQHGLPPSRLHYWVYQKGPATPRRRGHSPTVFQELKLPAGLPLSSWSAEISLPAGPVVRFSATATPAWMSAVIHALGQPC
jgi:hypothetical protein